jgi:hypothetical protein
MKDPGRQNIFEKIADKIPGYGGYLARERRRDIDKLHREHLAGSLQRLKNSLNDVTRELTETGRLMETRPLERTAGKLDKVENKIRYASYGYSGFFDVIKVDEMELERIYQFDLNLVESVDTIKSRLTAVQQASTEQTDLKAALTELERAIDNLDARFSERHKAIEGFGNL